MDPLLLAMALGGLLGGRDCGAPLAVSIPDARVGAPVPAPVLLALNIPAYRLDVYEGGIRTRSFRVAVGARKYPTPTGRFEVGRITWNPWWIPPKSEWARRERVTPPGPSNPLGKVKLQFRDEYYLHGTPLEESLGRAASHGCVRLANADAIELARLVQDVVGVDVLPAAVDQLVTSWEPSRTVELPALVPLEIRYQLAEVRDGRLEIHPDVYGRGLDVGALAWRALADAGIPADQVDVARLRELLREGRRREATAPLLELRVGAGEAERPVLQPEGKQ
jgi:murein L,D-transpeptidase YcbB/YkuD